MNAGITSTIASERPAPTDASAAGRPARACASATARARTRDRQERHRHAADPGEVGGVDALHGLREEPDAEQRDDDQRARPHRVRRAPVPLPRRTKASNPTEPRRKKNQTNSCCDSSRRGDRPRQLFSAPARCRKPSRWPHEGGIGRLRPPRRWNTGSRIMPSIDVAGPGSGDVDDVGERDRAPHPPKSQRVRRARPRPRTSATSASADGEHEVGPEQERRRRTAARRAGPSGGRRVRRCARRATRPHGEAEQPESDRADPRRAR